MSARLLTRIAFGLLGLAVLPIVLAFTPGIRDIDLSRFGPAGAYWMFFWIVGCSMVGTLVAVAGGLMARRSGQTVWPSLVAFLLNIAVGAAVFGPAVL